MTTLYIYSLIDNIKAQWGKVLRSAAIKKGWKVEQYSSRSEIEKDDILIIWNRHNDQDNVAKRFEAVGAKVFAIENPYIKTKDHKDWISVGIGYHNNLDYAPKLLDNGERFAQLGIEIKPWRQSGKHILFPTQAKNFNQAGLGWKDYAIPQGADESILKKIRKITDRKIVFRLSPKSMNVPISTENIGKNIEVSNNEFNRCSVNKDLENAWATCLWTSNAATESLLMGIPVFVCGPGVYMKDVCNMNLNDIENPIMPDNRLQLFNRMAWAQYNINEVESGFMFNCLLT